MANSHAVAVGANRATESTQAQRNLPSSTLLRHQVDLHFANQSSTVINQVLSRYQSNSAIDVLFYHFDLEDHRAGLWELQSLITTAPSLDIIVCVDSTDDRWLEVGQCLESEENLLIARTPLEMAEIRQLTLLLLRKRQQRNHLGRVCQEREQHVTSRTRHLNRALAESRRLLSAIDLVLIELDSRHVVRRWNHEAERLLGLSESTAVGCDVRTLSIPWDERAVVDNFLMADAATERTLEVSFQQVDHQPVILSLTKHIIHEPDEPSSVLVLGADLTEQRRLQQHLQQAQRLESVGQLAAGVAHEINTPMQYIGDNIDYLSSKFMNLLPYVEGTLKYLQDEGDLSSEEQEVLKKQLLQISKKQKLTRMASQIPDAFADSQQGLQHVTRIVRAMKELSHPGGAERTAVNVNHLLDTAITVSTNEWKYVADIQRHLTDQAVDVPGYSGELAQVFLNLIVNAAHAVADANEKLGRARGQIDIFSRVEARDMVIEIQDDGCGIPTEITDHVFDPFFTTKEVGKGTGQGLAIAHSVIVTKHQGSIDFHSSADRGTRFTIRLPIDQPCLPEGDQG
ncbi:MAG: ATP-binding protein [Fuerstiella sp.]